MTHVYITGVGRDKPGIVAGITEIIARHHGNIEDSTMTILGSQFASIMVGVFPPDVSLETLQAEFGQLQGRLGVQVVVAALEEDAKPLGQPMEERPYIISVAGHDRTGITFEITRILAKHQVNITDLNAHTIAGEDGPVYIMMVECTLPTALNRELFERELSMMGENLNVEITYHPVEHVAL